MSSAYKTCVVARTKQEALRFVDLMGMDRQQTITLTVGMSVVGQGLDPLILVGWRPGQGHTEDTPREVELCWDWYCECVMTRRPPGKQEYVYIPSFETGLSLPTPPLQVMTPPWTDPSGVGKPKAPGITPRIHYDSTLYTLSSKAARRARRTVQRLLTSQSVAGHGADPHDETPGDRVYGPDEAPPQ